MKRFIDNVKIVAACACIVAFICGLVYLDYSAYRQRFPNAAPWTYLFRGHK